MCNIFSGHIVTEPGKRWGEIIYITGTHHEIDREQIPTDLKVAAWETMKLGDFSYFKFTHTSGKEISDFEKEKLIILLKDWGKKQNKQKLLAKIAIEDENWRMRKAAISLLKDQKVLAKIAIKDVDWCVRQAATSLLKDQKVLAKIAIEDRDLFVRQAAISLLKDQKLLTKIAIKDVDWCVRQAATSLLKDQKVLAKIAIEDKDGDVRQAAQESLRCLK